MSRLSRIATLLLCCAAVVLLGTTGLVDPTRPPSRSAPSATTAAPDATDAATARVTAIVVSPDRRSAVVDGRTVSVGDQIGGAKVEEISLNGVRLRGDRGSFELRLFGFVSKRRVRESAP